ncbi:O-methyltransferase family protein [Viridothelium virens]|uniref:O-methyltransferase family protein n=1 Tax=Viridothelium virens TaxID=1048519 RepID=A0A6A6H9V0_VIRVR|nr:O-methyltransferase family protein [Viridothelium virens]
MDLNQLETWSNELVIAARTLSQHLRSDGTASTLNPVINKVMLGEADRARQSILTIAARLQTLLVQPAEFLLHLASQNQLLACLKWLGEFQVLACIPLSGSIPAKEVADLAGVPETQLCRVVRMTATAGFLHEHRPGHIAHTVLSAPFVTNLGFLDATMFLAETVAPTALQMVSSTQRNKNSESTNDSAYSITFNTPQPFQMACVERTRLQRQWSAYQRCVGDMDDSITELLSRLNWRSLGSATIVDVCAHSTETAIALADMHPALHLIVQMVEPALNIDCTVDVGKVEDFDGRVTVQRRMLAAVQVVKDAAVYILRLTTPSPPLPARILAELRAHLGVLRANISATLILAPPMLPEPGAVDPNIEGLARLHDLSRLQLINECGLELDKLIEIINSVHDSRGRLAVANKLRSRSGVTVALAVRYQAYTDDLTVTESALI